jgi:hypothetical protein
MEMTVEKLQDKYETILAERDAAVQIAGEALKEYKRNGDKFSATTSLLQALREIAAICPEMSGTFDA